MKKFSRMGSHLHIYVTTRNQGTGSARGREGSVRKAYGSVCESAAEVPARRETQRAQSARHTVACASKQEIEGKEENRNVN